MCPSATQTVGRWSPHPTAHHQWRSKIDAWGGTGCDSVQITSKLAAVTQAATQAVIQAIIQAVTRGTQAVIQAVMDAVTEAVTQAEGSKHFPDLPLQFHPNTQHRQQNTFRVSTHAHLRSRGPTKTCRNTTCTCSRTCSHLAQLWPPAPSATPHRQTTPLPRAHPTLPAPSPSRRPCRSR